MARKVVGRPAEETLSLWKREQALLKTLVVDRDTEAWQRDPAFSGLQRVGGVDVSFVKGDSVSACASLVVLSYPELEVLFVDGNGVLHHRDLPCIGVAKKLLQVDGLENNALHKEKIRLLKAGGDSFPLMGGSGTVLGMALKSHDHSTKPLYVSVGHKMSLEAAVRLTHGCCKFRIPEPVRQADIRSRDYIRRTLGVQGAPALQPERSKKAQRPKACPQGVSEEPAGSSDQVRLHPPGRGRAPTTVRTHIAALGVLIRNFAAQLGLRTSCFLQEGHLDPGSPFPQPCIFGLTFPSRGKTSKRWHCPGSFSDPCHLGPDKGLTRTTGKQHFISPIPSSSSVKWS
ncbi:endonuclease V isoform X8 [Balaenoptera acutorostrata]|uniref:Endonuclease V isoform X8 n=1 Tax=Balaenoptera acutorostrata TaxID=9767 RepID=A0ABM3SR71_BALAC|nr:endonuclease V isoform X8 [Balaenoptera acutorostrata]